MAAPAPTPANPISPADVATLQDRIARSEAELRAARARERELARALDATMSSVRTLPPIDLVIALDTTASMTGEVASLREEIAGLSALLADLTDDAAVGIIDFKDGCGGRRPCASPRSSASTKSPSAGWPPSPVRCAPARRRAIRRPTRTSPRRCARPSAPTGAPTASSGRSSDLRQPGPRPSPRAGRRRRPALLARPRCPAHRLGRARRHERPRRPGLSRYRGVHAARRRSGRRAVRPRRRERVAVGDDPACRSSTAETGAPSQRRPARSLPRLKAAAPAATAAMAETETPRPLPSEGRATSPRARSLADPTTSILNRAPDRTKPEDNAEVTESCGTAAGPGKGRRTGEAPTGVDAKCRALIDAMERIGTRLRIALMADGDAEPFLNPRELRDRQPDARLRAG